MLRRIALYKFTGIAAASVLLFTGCGKDNTAVSSVDNTIYFESKGSLEVTSVESFDKDYYDKDELSTMIEESIASYNESTGDESVKEKSLSVDNGEARLVMYYASADDYCDFNETDLYYGPLNGASMTGADFTPLLGTENRTNSKKTLGSEDLDEMEDYPVIVVYEPMKIRTDHKILFCTDNVAPEDDHKSAEIADTASETSPALIILNNK